MKQLLHISLPIDLLVRLDKYVEHSKHESRTSAATELLNIGLWFAEKRNELETIFKNPELMEELNTQFKEGGLVDFVERMNWQEFQVCWSIFKTEAKSRKML